MAEHRGDPLWEAKLARFFAVSEEFKTLWHQRNDVRGGEPARCLPILSWASLPCSRCTGTLHRVMDRGCWSICRWMTRGEGDGMAGGAGKMKVTRKQERLLRRALNEWQQEGTLSADEHQRLAGTLTRVTMDWQRLSRYAF